MIVCHPYPQGWVKPNVDGASKGNPRKTSCGGLFKDDEGKWLNGFTCNMGICNSIIEKF